MIMTGHCLPVWPQGVMRCEREDMDGEGRASSYQAHLQEDPVQVDSPQALGILNETRAGVQVRGD